MPQPRRSLRLLTPKCFISPARPPGRPGHPSVGLLCCVCGTHREEEEAQSCLGGPEGVSGTGSKSGFWCPFTCPPPTPHPSQIRPAVASETCSIFNPFLELALFFKEPGPVPCCPHSTPAPREERVNIYFYLFAFCVGMGLCPVPGGPM